jgi:hypothetical protein
VDLDFGKFYVTQLAVLQLLSDELICSVDLIGPGVGCAERDCRLDEMRSFWSDFTSCRAHNLTQ